MGGWSVKVSVRRRCPGDGGGTSHATSRAWIAWQKEKELVCSGHREEGSVATAPRGNGKECGVKIQRQGTARLRRTVAVRARSLHSFLCIGI